jgi:plasmid maintenance system antidote protein VapI
MPPTPGQRAIPCLARYFGFSPEYWFNMRAQYDLEAIGRQSIAEIERECKSRKAAWPARLC